MKRGENLCFLSPFRVSFIKPTQSRINANVFIANFYLHPCLLAWSLAYVAFVVVLLNFITMLKPSLDLRYPFIWIRVTEVAYPMLPCSDSPVITADVQVLGSWKWPLYCERVVWFCIQSRCTVPVSVMEESHRRTAFLRTFISSSNLY